MFIRNLREIPLAPFYAVFWVADRTRVHLHTRYVVPAQSRGEALELLHRMSMEDRRKNYASSRDRVVQGEVPTKKPKRDEQRYNLFLGYHWPGT